MTLYRILHFVPDPFVGSRMPIAAVTQRADGRVVIVRVPTPLAACVGGQGAALLVRAALGDLAATTNIDELPAGLGPQVIATPAQHVPAGVDPEAWLARLLTPPATHGASELVRVQPPRATEGLRFFENYRVAHYVRRLYRPPAGDRAHTFGPISLFVPGRRETLLMEPISFRRPNAAEEFREAAKILAAYKVALDNDPRRQVLGYVLAGGPADERARAIGELRAFVDVYDTAMPHDRDGLVERVRSVGATLETDTLA